MREKFEAFNIEGEMKDAFDTFVQAAISGKTEKKYNLFWEY